MQCNSKTERDSEVGVRLQTVRERFALINISQFELCYTKIYGHLLALFGKVEEIDWRCKCVSASLPSCDPHWTSTAARSLLALLPGYSVFGPRVKETLRRRICALETGIPL